MFQASGLPGLRARPLSVQAVAAPALHHSAASGSLSALLVRLFSSGVTQRSSVWLVTLVEAAQKDCLRSSAALCPNPGALPRRLSQWLSGVR